MTLAILLDYNPKQQDLALYLQDFFQREASQERSVEFYTFDNSGKGEGLEGWENERLHRSSWVNSLLEENPDINAAVEFSFGNCQDETIEGIDYIGEGALVIDERIYGIRREQGEQWVRIAYRLDSKFNPESRNPMGILNQLERYEIHEGIPHLSLHKPISMIFVEGYLSGQSQREKNSHFDQFLRNSSELIATFYDFLEDNN